MPQGNENSDFSLGAEATGSEFVVDAAPANDGATSYAESAAPESAPAPVDAWKGPSREEWEGVTRSYSTVQSELSEIKALMRQGLTRPEAKQVVAEQKAEAAQDDADEFSDPVKYEQFWQGVGKNPRALRSLLHREAKNATKAELSEVAALRKEAQAMREELNTLHGHAMYSNKRFATDPKFAPYDAEFLKIINSGKVHDPDVAFELAKARVDAQNAAKAKAAPKAPPKPAPRVDATLTPSRAPKGETRAPAGFASPGARRGKSEFRMALEESRRAAS